MLCAAMLISALGGCGGGTQAQASETAAVSEAVSAADSAGAAAVSRIAVVSGAAVVSCAAGAADAVSAAVDSAAVDCAGALPPQAVREREAAVKMAASTFPGTAK